MSLEISTAGIFVKYAAEATAGVKPTTGYTVLPNIKSTPDINQDPNMLDCTDLSVTDYKRYIPGLRDIGSAFPFGANLTPAFQTAWEALVSDYETAKAAGKEVWFEISVPTNGSFYFTGAPVPLGVNSFEVDQVAEVTAYVVPNTVRGWDDSST